MILTDANNDIYLDAGNNIALARTNLEAVKQLINCKLKTFKGEIFTDTDIGTDWFGLILTDTTTIATKNEELKRVILSCDGVISVDSIKYFDNKESGEIEFEIDVTCVYGTIKINDLSLGA